VKHFGRVLAALVAEDCAKVIAEESASSSYRSVDRAIAAIRARYGIKE